jgi:formylglycine-generating enzyme required for sulfatase activity
VEKVLLDYLDRLRSHGRPAVDRWLAQEGEVCSRLQQHLPVLESLRQEDFQPDVLPALPESSDLTLLWEVARGGMGVVYLSWQRSLNRLVAVKLLLSASPTERSVRRFQREAQALARLTHPGIVSTFGYGDLEGRPYLVMEWVPGQGLDEVFAERQQDPERYSVQQLVRWAKDIADAVAVAHGAGIVHRDLKPSNIRVRPDGRAVLLDFGLAQDPSQPSLSESRQFQGSMHYAAPEQIAGPPASIGPATDIYALGITLYEGLTGKLPYVGQSTHEVIHQILTKPPELAAVEGVKISEDLQTILLKTLEKEPRHRYSRMEELEADLSAVLTLKPIRAQRPSRLRRAGRWVGANPALAGVLMAACLAVLWTSFWIRDQSRQLEAEAADSRRNKLAAYTRLGDVRRMEVLAAKADRELWPRRMAKLPALDDWLSTTRQVLTRFPEHQSSLADLRARATLAGEVLVFPTIELEWQHRVVKKLVEDLLHLQNVLLPDVEDRRAMSEDVYQQSILDCADAWEEVALEVADDPRFDGLRFVPREGLVPLGPDLDSGLWEFWVAETGGEPEPDEDRGGYRMTADSGMVLVLLPGGEATIGSSLSPLSPRHDPWALAEEGPVHSVKLSAFLISKYEMTQAQWLRVTGSNPSEFAHQGRALESPIESISQQRALHVLQRLEMDLPTEAQWEFAARAGSDAPWPSGVYQEAVQDTANLWEAGWEQLGVAADGYLLTSPIGLFEPNRFGLHDTVGNVFEICKDAFHLYQASVPRPGDGLRQGTAESPFFSTRGGGYRCDPPAARSSYRIRMDRKTASGSLGLRPCVNLEP